MSTQRKSATQSERDPDMAGAEAAMHRAARRARERAAQTANTTTALPSAKNSGDLPKPETDHGVHSSWLDNGQYSYSQAQGYEGDARGRSSWENCRTMRGQESGTCSLITSVTP